MSSVGIPSREELLRRAAEAEAEAAKVEVKAGDADPLAFLSALADALDERVGN
jgi:hypothetical protein